MAITITANAAHLIAKVLDHIDGAVLTDLGFSDAECEKADEVFKTVGEYVAREFGPDWDEREVL